MYWEHVHPPFPLSADGTVVTRGEEVNMENGMSPALGGSDPSHCDGAELMDGAVSAIGASQAFYQHTPIGSSSRTVL